MPRVKRGTIVRQKHKKILAQAKGYRHGRKNLIKQAKQALLKAGQFAYRDRRVKKRTFRSLWIVRLNAAVRPYDLSYSQFIRGLDKANIDLNRKVLSELAVQEPEEFKKVVEKVKATIK